MRKNITSIFVDQSKLQLVSAIFDLFRLWYSFKIIFLACSHYCHVATFLLLFENESNCWAREMSVLSRERLSRKRSWMVLFSLSAGLFEPYLIKALKPLMVMPFPLPKAGCFIWLSFTFPSFHVTVGLKMSFPTCPPYSRRLFSSCSSSRGTPTLGKEMNWVLVDPGPMAHVCLLFCWLEVCHSVYVYLLVLALQASHSWPSGDGVSLSLRR